MLVHERIMVKRILIAAVLLTITLAAYSFGQRRFGGGRQFGPSGGQCLVPGYRGDGSEDLPTPRKIDRSGFVYARLRDRPGPWRGQGKREIPLHHDYPDGDTMFAGMLGRLTTAQSTPESYQIVDIDSKELFKYPFVYLSEPGYLDL